MSAQQNAATTADRLRRVVARWSGRFTPEEIAAAEALAQRLEELAAHPECNDCGDDLPDGRTVCDRCRRRRWRRANGVPERRGVPQTVLLEEYRHLRDRCGMKPADMPRVLGMKPATFERAMCLAKRRGLPEAQDWTGFGRRAS